MERLRRLGVSVCVMAQARAVSRVPLCPVRKTTNRNAAPRLVGNTHPKVALVCPHLALCPFGCH